MIGKIIKGIGGFYYVDTGTSVYECRAVGIFRKENKKPMVGDDVVIEVLSEEEKTGSLVEICPRKNELIRPAVANIDQMLMERHLAKKARRSTKKHHLKGPAKRTSEDDARFEESFEKMIRKVRE